MGSRKEKLEMAALLLDEAEILANQGLHYDAANKVFAARRIIFTAATPAQPKVAGCNNTGSCSARPN